MAQAEVHDFLVQNPGKQFTSGEIAHAIGMCRNTTALNCMKVAKLKHFSREKTIKIRYVEYLYGYKVKKCKKTKSTQKK